MVRLDFFEVAVLHSLVVVRRRHPAPLLGVKVDEVVPFRLVPVAGGIFCDFTAYLRSVIHRNLVLLHRKCAVETRTSLNHLMDAW
jgi:hypothetical protein